MTKRYGRNQKRRDKALISQQEEVISRLEDRNHNSREQERELRLLEDKLFNMFGSAFAIFLAEDFVCSSKEQLRHILEYGLRVDIPKGLDFIWAMSDRAAKIDIITRTLPVISTSKPMMDHFTGAVHYNITYNDKRYGYAASKNTVRLLGRQHVEDVVKSLAHSVWEVTYERLG